MRQIFIIAAILISHFNVLSQDLDKGLVLKYDFNHTGLDSVSKNTTDLEGVRFANDFCESEKKSIEFVVGSPKIELPYDETVFKGKTGLTFSAWVYYKKDKEGKPYFIAGQWGKKYSDRRFNLLLDENHHINFQVHDGLKNEVGITSDKKLYDEVWYHVVGVYFPDERYQIYLNGQLHGMGIQTGTGINQHTDLPLVLGNQMKGDSTNLVYKGRLDKVRLYNRALSLYEIQSLYSHEKNDECIVEHTIQCNVNDLLTNESISANIHLNHVGKKENHPFSFGWDGQFKFKTEENAQYAVRLIAENYFEYTDTIGPFNQDSWVNLKMKPIELERVFTIKNLHFKQGSAQMLPTSYPSLDKLVQMMIDNENLEIELHGHTDNIGDSALNQVLSVERVEEVKKYLIEKGVNESRVTGKGFGGSKPLSTKMDPLTRRLNRRVEFVVTKY